MDYEKTDKDEQIARIAKAMSHPTRVATCFRHFFGVKFFIR